jgi:hypothetical protein
MSSVTTFLVVAFPFFYGFTAGSSNKVVGIVRVIDLGGKLCLSKSYTSLSLVTSDRCENVRFVPRS